MHLLHLQLLIDSIILLSGCHADEENKVTEILHIFHQSSSKEKNIHSWVACAAILCTRQAQYHHAVHHELEPVGEQHDGESYFLLHAEVMISIRKITLIVHQKYI
jgi:hypothetical protein